MNNLFYFLDSKDNIYTIRNRELKKIDTKNIEPGFELTMLKSITKERLNKYTPLKLCIISNKNINNIKISQNNSFILFNTSQFSNIFLKENHLMLATNNKKTWFNFYDGKVYGTFVSSDKYKIIDYINNNCKMNNEINQRFNFVLLKLNKGETFLNLYKQIYPTYKKTDNEISFKNNKLLCKSANLINLLESKTQNILSLKEFK